MLKTEAPLPCRPAWDSRETDCVNMFAGLAFIEGPPAELFFFGSVQRAVEWLTNHFRLCRIETSAAQAVKSRFAAMAGVPERSRSKLPEAGRDAESLLKPNVWDVFRAGRRPRKIFMRIVLE